MKRLLQGWTLPLFALLAACAGEAPDTAVSPPKPVKLVTVGADDSLSSRRFLARVEASRTIDLHFQVGGRLQALPVQTGTRVAAGTRLAELDARDYRLAVQEAETQARDAARNLQRGRDLFQREVISQADLDLLVTRHELAQTGLAHARLQLAYTRLDAPFDALITRRYVEAPTLVSPQAPVLRIQDVSRLRVVINVPEHLIHHVDQVEQLRAEALLSAQGPRLPLTYLEHQTQPDPAAQTYPVSFTLPAAAASELLPGMTLTVEVALQPGIAAAPLLLPLSALDKRDPAQVRVWVYDPQQQRVQARPVTLGPLQDDQVRILTGLAAGEQVVAAGAETLHDGQPAKPFRLP